MAILGMGMSLHDMCTCMCRPLQLPQPMSPPPAAVTTHPPPPRRAAMTHPRPAAPQTAATPLPATPHPHPAATRTLQTARTPARSGRRASAAPRLHLLERKAVTTTQQLCQRSFHRPHPGRQCAARWLQSRLGPRTAGLTARMLTGAAAGTTVLSGTGPRMAAVVTGRRMGGSAEGGLSRHHASLTAQCHLDARGGNRNSDVFGSAVPCSSG